MSRSVNTRAHTHTPVTLKTSSLSASRHEGSSSSAPAPAPVASGFLAESCEPLAFGVVPFRLRKVFSCPLSPGVDGAVWGAALAPPAFVRAADAWACPPSATCFFLKHQDERWSKMKLTRVWRTRPCVGTSHPLMMTTNRCFVMIVLFVTVGVKRTLSRYTL